MWVLDLGTWLSNNLILLTLFYQCGSTLGWDWQKYFAEISTWQMCFILFALWHMKYKYTYKQSYVHSYITLWQQNTLGGLLLLLFLSCCLLSHFISASLRTQAVNILIQLPYGITVCSSYFWYSLFIKCLRVETVFFKCYSKVNRLCFSCM